MRATSEREWRRGAQANIAGVPGALPLCAGGAAAALGHELSMGGDDVALAAADARVHERAMAVGWRPISATHS